jgi:hypothetical protein
VASAADPLLFIYFKEPADMGIFYAVSDDGYHFKTLNGGRPWIGIEHANELIRDPFVTRGPDGEFHMVWTWGWRGTSIGYAHSRDLVHWSEQREIPLMAGTPGTRNTWAPEIYWDAGRKQWMAIWSSTVEGKHEGNRIYHAFTSDFRTFTAPAIFFDPGYVSIDATILHARDRYYMVFKDERQEPELRRCLRIAEAPALTGPWSNISGPLTEAWSEGPSLVPVGGGYIIYFDHYRDPKRYQAIRSSDLKTWTAVTDQMSLPALAKHGSFVAITTAERDRLVAGRGATIAQSLPDLYHGERAGDPPYLSEAGWRPLLNGRDLAGWHAVNNAASEWFTAAAVNYQRVFSPTRLIAKAAPGDRIVNGKDGRTASLVTDATFGSFELYAEFLLAKGSNSGIYLHGLYEVQIFDSYGFNGALTAGDLGGIYERPDGTAGSPPARNAAKPPGEWQSLHIWFQAPRFDANGRMSGRAKILRVLLNGVPVQENVTLVGPTTGAMNLPEAAKNPILLQGDHGPVAFRNLYVREFE